MRHALGITALALIGLTLSPPPSLAAQVRASERGEVMQTVDGTTVTVNYSRPRARGRAPIFGNVVHWDEVWTPGANDATTLELSEDVTLEGHDIPSGIYSVWMVVREGAEWELVLDPRPELFHTMRPEPTEDQIRFAVAPEPNEPVDILTWSFPAYSSTGMTLRMAWGELQVPLEIEVEPSMRRVVTEEEAAPYLGEWEMASGEDDPFGEAAVPFDIRHADDGTLQVTTQFPAPGWPEPTILMLMPMAEGVFLPGLVVDGELRDSFEGTMIEFVFEGDEAVVFAFRGPDDEVFARGERKR